MAVEIYSVDGWYQYRGRKPKIPQNGTLELDLESGRIRQGYVYDRRWGYADIEGELSKLSFRFTKHYGDGSDNVEYMMLPEEDGWKGRWKAERYDGTAQLWLVRRAIAEPGDFSFDKATAKQLRPRKPL